METKAQCTSQWEKVETSFDEIIKNDAFDHITENIFSYCDGETIESCRTVSHQFNRAIMECEKSVNKLIKRIRYVRFLVHPIFKSILVQVEAEGNYNQKQKLAKMLINFNYCQKFEFKDKTIGFDFIGMANFFLGKMLRLYS